MGGGEEMGGRGGQGGEDETGGDGGGRGERDNESVGGRHTGELPIAACPLGCVCLGVAPHLTDVGLHRDKEPHTLLLPCSRHRTTQVHAYSL